MIYSVAALFMFILISNEIGITLPQKTSTLQQVHVVFRHGHRTPEKFGLYPTDPYLNETWYPEGSGQLTNLGKEQEYKIGKFLHKLYGNFLSDLYTNDALDAISTDSVRTKMSLLCTLAGLWPPNNSQKFANDLPWQPIPYSYLPMKDDRLLGYPLFFCPKYREYYNEASHSKEVQLLFEENKQKIEHMNKNAGLNITTIFDLYVLYLVLLSEEGMNRTLPEWTKEVYPEFLAEIAPKEYLIQSANINMIKYTGGFLLRKILTDIEGKINGTLEPPGRKLFLYSAHEYNVAHALIALNVFKPHIPSYSARVIYEYHKIGTAHYIKIFHYDLTFRRLQLLRIPGCAFLCPINQFKKLVQDVLPTANTEC